MLFSYAQKHPPAQKKNAPTASSVLDSSSQSDSLQRKADMANKAAQRAETPRPNNTGMPDNLKAGIESLSGFSMDDVRVHYNSSKPATVQALAYTQGTDIHVAPGQEKHLPHEAWHVAQQMAGRVSPTTNINGMPVNDNAALEHEADVMGEKAVQYNNSSSITKSSHFFTNSALQCQKVLQRVPYWKNQLGNPIQLAGPESDDEYWKCSATDVVICQDEDRAKTEALNALSREINGDPVKVVLHGNEFYFYENTLENDGKTIHRIVKHNHHYSIALPSLDHMRGRCLIEKYTNLIHFHTIQLSFPQDIYGGRYEDYNHGKDILIDILAQNPKQNFTESTRHYLIAPRFFERR